MKFKILSIISLIFIFFLILFYTYCFLQKSFIIEVFKSYTSTSSKIDKDLINQLYHNNTEISTAAEKEIIKITLTAIGYEKWQEYVEHIQLKIYTEEVLPTNNKNLIVALNLSKDLAVVAIFEDSSKEYVFYDKIENLLPINNLEFLTTTPPSNKMLLIYQTLDEKLGAYLHKEILQIYQYSPENFKIAWEKTLSYEEIYKETWIDPKADINLWNKIIEKTTIDFVEGNPNKINTSTVLEKHISTSSKFPSAEDFALIQIENFEHSYQWNEKYNRFVLGIIAKEVFLSEIALLEDMTKEHAKFYGIMNNNFKVINSKNEILYLPKNQFETMFKSLLEQ